MGLILTMNFSIVSFARENKIKKSYAELSLTCYIKCTATVGSGYTEGANMDGYRNYIKVCIYDINHNIKSSKEKYDINRASSSISSTGIYMTRTFHAAAYSNGTQLLPTYQQLQQTQGR